MQFADGLNQNTGIVRTFVADVQDLLVIQQRVLRTVAKPPRDIIAELRRHRAHFKQIDRNIAVFGVSADQLDFMNLLAYVLTAETQHRVIRYVDPPIHILARPGEETGYFVGALKLTYISRGKLEVVDLHIVRHQRLVSSVERMMKQALASTPAYSTPLNIWRKPLNAAGHTDRAFFLYIASAAQGSFVVSCNTYDIVLGLRLCIVASRKAQSSWCLRPATYYARCPLRSDMRETSVINTTF
jgi:hypothetical protein